MKNNKKWEQVVTKLNTRRTEIISIVKHFVIYGKIIGDKQPWKKIKYKEQQQTDFLAAGKA